MPEGNDIHDFYRSIKEIEGRTLKSTRQKVLRVYPKGKVLFVDLTDGQTIVMRFGMTGYVTLSKKPPRYTKKTVEFTKGDPLQWVSVRKLGSYQVMPTQKAKKIFASLGPDPLLNPVWVVRARLDTRSGRLASVLMDQSFISGIGNRLRAQILWEARLNPHRKLKDLTSREKDLLASKIHDVMKYRPYADDVYRNPAARRDLVDGRVMWWFPDRQK